jgi:murein tripeptide amidase MpaA
MIIIIFLSTFAFINSYYDQKQTMKHKHLIIIVCTFFIISSSFSQQTEKYSKVRVSCNNINELITNGIEFIGGSYSKKGFFEGEVNTNDIEKLETLGFEFTILIDDISDFYVKRNEKKTSSNTKNIVYNCGQPKDYSTPQHFKLGSMGGFLTFDEAISELDSMRILFPDLISEKSQIGLSIENRPIYAYKISDNPDINESEKQVLYTSVHHSQEPCGLQQLIFFMYYLLENYNQPEIKFMIDNLEIYFVPVVNPDGYVYNETQNPAGGGTWRKNRRPNGLFNGVDLNRNYDYAFGYNEIGSSSIGVHPWYRGTAAFSEPESQAMKTFIESHDFLLDLNWHSYGDFLIYPWNYETLLTNDSVAFEEFSRYLTLESHYRFGTCDQTYGYNSNGDADDWGYGNNTNKNKIFSFTAEIGSNADGFWPQSTNIIPLCKKSLDMNIRFARLATKYALVSDVSPTFISSTNSKISFEVYCLGLDTVADFTVSLTSLSQNVLATGSPIQFNGMKTLERKDSSIVFTIAPGVVQGTVLPFELSISNGIFTWRDTINKIFAVPDTLLKDQANDLTNWTSNGFSVTSESFSSAPSSFTESPGGNYSLLQSSSLVLNTELDLTTADHAYLLFKAIWEMEKSYDWVEVYASIDNGASWTPLCGKYSSYGTDDQNLSEPIYDGFLNSWINEEIPLNDFIGNNIKIKFEFHADQTHNFNGIYLDDIYVLSFKDESDISEIKSENDLYVYPNPSNGRIKIILPENFCKKTVLEINDIFGKNIFSKEVHDNGKTISIDIANISNGSYFLKLSSDKSTIIKKIVIIH